MDGQAIIDHFESLFDDSLDSDHELRLARVAYDRVCARRMWNFLRSNDQTNTLSASDRSYDLPDDHLYPRAARFYHTATGAYSAPLKPVRYEDRRRYEGQFGYFFIDLKNNSLTLTFDPTSTYSGWKLDFDYNYQPTEFELDEEPVFNRAFHALIAYEMGRHAWYSEQDEKDRSWNKEMNDEYVLMLREMEQWDDRLETASDPDLTPLDSWVPPEGQ